MRAENTRATTAEHGKDQMSSKRRSRLREWESRSAWTCDGEQSIAEANTNPSGPFSSFSAFAVPRWSRFYSLSVCSSNRGAPPGKILFPGNAVGGRSDGLGGLSVSAKTDVGSRARRNSGQGQATRIAGRPWDRRVPRGGRECKKRVKPRLSAIGRHRRTSRDHSVLRHRARPRLLA